MHIQKFIERISNQSKLEHIMMKHILSLLIEKKTFTTLGKIILYTPPSTKHIAVLSMIHAQVSETNYANWANVNKAALGLG